MPPQPEPSNPQTRRLSPDKLISTVQGLLALLGSVAVASFTAGVFVQPLFVEPKTSEPSDQTNEQILDLQSESRRLEGELARAQDDLDQLRSENTRLARIELLQASSQRFGSARVDALPCHLHDQGDNTSTLICPFEFLHDPDLDLAPNDPNALEQLCVFGNGTTEAHRSLLIPAQGPSLTQPHVSQDATRRSPEVWCMPVPFQNQSRFNLYFYNAPRDLSDRVRIEVRVGSERFFPSGQLNFNAVAVQNAQPSPSTP